MTCTVAHHQGAVKTFWLHLWEALISLYFAVNGCIHEQFYAHSAFQNIINNGFTSGKKNPTTQYWENPSWEN